ncbi:hypothetical protein EK21DRAFT_118385 [Setomelanomma holmii]|uniref:Uncharacterized protein n=1 Tax=Setomelanomma holmii TaxID=210430 RepID=A0A9P4LEZ0_9PLEO|nr:hypothetical protein EK21DRAFT_118385 [Setomelanomma holmii]
MSVYTYNPAPPHSWSTRQKFVNQPIFKGYYLFNHQPNAYNSTATSIIERTYRIDDDVDFLSNYASFVTLPGEIRNQIYSNILEVDDSTTTSTKLTLEDYKGLILSCKQIYREFEGPWAKWTNTLFAGYCENTMLIAPTVQLYTKAV